MSQSPEPADAFSFSDAFGQSATLYADNFKLFFFPSLVAAVLPVVMIILDNTGVEFLQGLWFVFLPFAFSIQVVVFLALIQMISRRSLNEDVDVKIVFQNGLLDFWKGSGALLLFGLILVVGLILLVIPFFYWLTIFSFFIYFIALEDARIWESFRLSEDLVAGRFFLVLKAHAVVLATAVAIFLPIMLGLGLMGIDGEYRLIIFRILGSLGMPFFLGFYYFFFCWLKKTKAVAGTIAVYEKS